jgi:O-antigen/teichoic acid export membrane protein
LSSVRRSLGYTFAESYLGLVLQIISTFFLARLLTPTETGIWAVAAVFSAVAATMHDFGAQEYLIQQKEFTHAKLRAAMTANFFVSWLLALVLVVASGPLATFYREPGVAEVMRVQACNFVLIPFGATTYAWFRRNLNYRPFFWASLLSSSTSFTVALTLAWLGFGYMALAWSSLSGVIVTVVVATIVRPGEFPRLPGVAGLRELAVFGAHTSGVYLLGQMGKSAPELILGRTLGMAPVAFFSRANGLTELFNRTVIRAAMPVCLPYFSREVRGGADGRQAYLRAVTFLTALAWPFFGCLGAMAVPAIRILYGTQWLESIPLARVLCAVAAVEVVYLLAKDVLIANGEVRAANYLQAAVQCARVVGLLAAIPFGLMGACWGLFGAALFGAACSHRVLHAKIGLTVGDVARASRPNLLLALAGAAPAVAWAAFGTIDEHNFFVTFVVAGAIAGAAWLGCIALMGHPLWQEIRRLLTTGLAGRFRAAE